MTADVVWPLTVLKPAAAKLSPVSFSTSGGVSFDGSEQVVGNTPGRWKLELANIYLTTPQQVAEWHAIEGILQGRVGTIDVPVFDFPRAPWPTVNGQILASYGGIPFANGMTFANGQGFSLDVIQAFTIGDTAEGSNVATIQIQYGAALAPGMHFGYDERVFRIVAITGTGSSGGYPTYTVKFTLPAREDIPSGSQLCFDNPMLRCRLETDDAMAFKGGLNLWRRAAPSLTLWEDV